MLRLAIWSHTFVDGDAFFENLKWKNFVTILQMLYSLDMLEPMYILPTPLLNMPESFPLSHANSTPPYPNALFIALCANSTPRKVTALAGTALAIAGPIPGKNALKPPLA